MKRVQIERSAVANLENIVAYSTGRWGYAQAEAYSDKLSEAIASIASGDGLSHRIPTAFEVDGYVRQCGSHLIYWRCGDDDVVRIVAVLHQRMHQSLRLREALEGEP